MSKQKLIIGIDPGLGVNSPCAIAMFTPDGYIVRYFLVTNGGYKDVNKRLQFVSRSVIKGIHDYCEPLRKNTEFKISIETFMMRGKSGESLQRLIGAIIAGMPDYLSPVTEVFNTTVKLKVGGHGKADKKDVAKGVLYEFRHVHTTRLRIEEWIENEEWDYTDAIAIGLAGMNK